MTLEEVERMLPNGLHDAEVQRITVDYQQRKLTAELAVWVGDVGDPPDRREAYKDARLDITGLLFLVMESPDPRYPYRNSSKLTIDGTDMRKNLDVDLLTSLPAAAFFRSLWVNQWNAFIHIAAEHSEITWLNNGQITYRTPQELKANS